MTSADVERLRRQLPPYFWLRDAEDGGGILGAWIRALAGEHAALSDAIDALYHDLFIETCAELYVPLIGAGIGVDGLTGIAAPGVSDRAWVGRILGLRRRKGMLETVARGATAATGWAAEVREGRPLTAATFAIGDVPAGATTLAQIGTPARGAAAAEPLHALARTPAFRGQTLIAGEQAAIDPRQPAGFPAPAMVELAVGRLRSFRVTGRTAAAATDAPAELAGRAFRCDPLGRDVPLFTTVADDGNHAQDDPFARLPRPLTIARLAQALRRPGQAPVAVADHALAAADLSRWAVPPTPSDHALVDPRHGRLVLPAPAAAAPAVDYAYGSAGEIGAGPFASPALYEALPDDAELLAVGSGADLRATPPVRHGAIVFHDSATHPVGDWRLAVRADGDLRLQAEPLAAPVLLGDVTVQVPAGARLLLAGLTVAGTVTVAGEGAVHVEQCTLLAPGGRPGLRCEGRLTAFVAHAVVSGLEAGDDTTLAVRASIVDGPASAGQLQLDGVTALRDVRAGVLLASDCLLTAGVAAHAGLVQTSYVRDPAVATRACLEGPDNAPRFTSTDNAHPGFCQLDVRCPSAAGTCAAHGGEPGAYGFLRQPERLARLAFVVANLLPAGVGAGVRFIT